MTAPSLFSGFGKLVLSGDTIVVRERALDGPPKSFTVMLSNISCPRVARKPGANGKGGVDEAFGWMAREFVRAKVVGKEICYAVESEVSPDRVFGSIFLRQPGGVQNLAYLLVSEGLAKVKKGGQALVGENPSLQALLALEEKAKTENKGIWSDSPSGAPRNVSWSLSDPAAFFSAHKKVPLRGIVEFIHDGNTLQIQLLPVEGDPSLTYNNITMLLSGLKAPGSKMVDGVRVWEEFAQDSKFYVESRLLQQDVSVILESFSNNTFVGSVLHTNGNIALFLLREGLARCLEWNLAVVSAEAGGAVAYREAERVAKEKRLRIWQNYQPPPSEASATSSVSKTDKKAPLETECVGVVVEVGNGDNVSVKCADGRVRKFFLASIRPPRGGEEKNSQAGARPLYQIPHLFEAREFLRKRLIGKQVRVFVDYIQPKPEDSTLDDRVCATVMVGDTNIGEALVQRGLASVVRYRKPTDSRSRDYDALLAAEAQAEKKAIGIFDSKVGAPPQRLSELGGNMAKSRQFLSSLQRAGTVDALVEFVVSASRLRLHIFRENLLTVALVSGIISPRPTRRTANQTEEREEPFGDEAREYARDIVMQREVKFDCEGLDRLGNLIGSITLPSEVKVMSCGVDKQGKKGKSSRGPCFVSRNLGAVLVARGYAYVNRAPSAQRTSQYGLLLKAESFAREHNLGLWSSEEFRMSWESEQGLTGHGDEGDEVAEANADSNKLISVDELKKALPDTDANREAAAARLKSAKSAQVTLICSYLAGSDGLRFFVHLDSRIGLLESMKRQLNSPDFASTMSSTKFQPKRGTICAARYSQDNLWYRARVLRVAGKIVTIMFIDFGDEESVDTGVAGAPRLAALPKNLEGHEPVATPYRLAYVQLPPDSDDRKAALEYLTQRIGDVNIRVSPVPGPATPCGKDDNRPVHSAVVYVCSKQPNEPSGSADSASDVIDVGEELLSNGLVYMERARMPSDICVRYSEAQQSAMRGRRNIWRYGDFRDDDAA